MSENRCVICGAVIPEGRQVCPSCDSNPYIQKKCRCGREIPAYREVCYECEYRENEYIIPYKTPCKKCDRRTYDCHIKCKEYQMYAECNTFLVDMAREQRKVDAYIRGNIINRGVKNLYKKRYLAKKRRKEW